MDRQVSMRSQERGAVSSPFNIHAGANSKEAGEGNLCSARLYWFLYVTDYTSARSGLRGGGGPDSAWTLSDKASHNHTHTLHVCKHDRRWWMPAATLCRNFKMSHVVLVLTLPPGLCSFQITDTVGAAWGIINNPKNCDITKGLFQHSMFLQRLFEIGSSRGDKWTCELKEQARFLWWNTKEVPALKSLGSPTHFSIEL